MRLHIFILLTSLLFPTFTIARGGGGGGHGGSGGSSSSSDSDSHSDSDSSSISGDSSASSNNGDSFSTPRMDVLPTDTGGGCGDYEISCGTGCAPQGSSCCGYDEFCSERDYCVQGGCCPKGKTCSSSSSGSSSTMHSDGGLGMRDGARTGVCLGFGVGVFVAGRII